MGWNDARASARPSALLDGLDGEDVYFAHSYAADVDGEPVVAARRPRGRGRRRGRVGRRRGRPVPPRAQRRRRARACSRTRCDGQEARDPLPRRRGRAGRQGRPLRVAARGRRARSSSRRATRRSARTSSSSSTSPRRSRAAARCSSSSSGRRRRSSMPFTVGGGVSGLEDARALLRAGADKVAVNRAAVDDPALLTALADEFGAQAVVCAIDARGGEVVTHARPQPARARRRRVGGRGGRARRRRAARHLDRRRRHARRLRPRADAARSPTRSPSP